MPIYEYYCRKCGRTFEHLARSSADPVPNCAHCGTPDPAKQFSTFAARADAAAGAACDSCPTTASCPSAGHHCCGGACSH